MFGCFSVCTGDVPDVCPLSIGQHGGGGGSGIGVNPGLDSVRSEYRRYAAIAVIVCTLLQPFYRFDLGPVEYEARPSM